MSNKIILAFVGGLILILGLLVFLDSRQERIDPDLEFDNQEFSFTYFYSPTCPFCQIVSDFISEEEIDIEAIGLQMLNVSNSTRNSQLLGLAARDCGLDTSQIGVPFLYHEGRCYIGPGEVINVIETVALGVEIDAEVGSQEDELSGDDSEEPLDETTQENSEENTEE